MRAAEKDLIEIHEDTDCERNGKVVAPTEQNDSSEPYVRAQWGSKVDFILSCVGYAVGLGNVWRFPYVCYKSGGGAFLIPYVIFLVVAGIPLFCLELALGQFSASGPITVWSCAPLFRGLGWTMAFISFVVAMYYNVLISWCFFYLANCFQSRLPWSHCENDFNTQNCADSFGAQCTGPRPGLLGNGSMYG